MDRPTHNMPAAYAEGIGGSNPAFLVQHINVRQVLYKTFKVMSVLFCFIVFVQ